MTNFDLGRVGDEEFYRLLMELLFKLGSSVSMVVRDEKSLSLRATQFLEEASDGLIRRSMESKWPGTELFGGEAVVYYFRATTSLKKLILENTNNMDDWLEPSMPEDIAFYRANGSILFGSVVHEGDAFVLLEDQEMGEHLGQCRKLGLVRQGHPGDDLHRTVKPPYGDEK